MLLHSGLGAILLQILYAQMPTFYHTSSVIYTFIYFTPLLSKSTKKLIQFYRDVNMYINFKHIKSESPFIYTLTFNHPTSQRKQNALIIFGEHSRELISVETGLRLVEKLCDQKNMHAQAMLSKYHITIIVNMNPLSRQYVEKGFFCLRENENGVDLNRNYNVKWKHVINIILTPFKVEDHTLQISSGEKPFSEVQTRIVKDLLDQLRPKVFLSIHSGTLGILQPYAYIPRRCKDEKLYRIGLNLARQFCQQCLVGSAAEEVGYTASGCSQDYAYDEASVPYSYTFEIHSYNIKAYGEHSPTLSQGMSKHQKKLIHHKKQEKTLIQKVKPTEEPVSNFAEFLELRDRDESEIDQLTARQCFLYFNPPTEYFFEHSINHWSSAIMKMLSLISIEEGW